MNVMDLPLADREALDEYSRAVYGWPLIGPQNKPEWVGLAALIAEDVPLYSA
jgi:hypothetical protein